VGNRPDYIIVGRVGRPRGVSGQINIDAATDSPDRFLDLRNIMLVVDGARKSFRVESAELIGGRPVIRVQGVGSREEASRLTGLSIEIPIAEAITLPEGRFFQFDLIGCRLIGCDGTDYGEIEEIMFYPANDLFRVVSPRFGETLFPVVDRFVLAVDIAARRVIVDPPSGLFTPVEGS
jgi:16S rRNA processing protein RimM